MFDREPTIRSFYLVMHCLAGEADDKAMYLKNPPDSGQYPENIVSYESMCMRHGKRNRMRGTYHLKSHSSMSVLVLAKDDDEAFRLAKPLFEKKAAEMEEYARKKAEILKVQEKK